MRTYLLWAATIWGLAADAAPLPAVPGDAARGERLFGACRACHTLVPGWHRTGPSLAGVWGRRAGSTADFGRYSAALKRSSLVWGAETLDAWLADPQRLVPGNGMVFGGIGDPRARADLIAYLRAASERPPEVPPADSRTAGGMPDLTQLPAAQRVTAIRHCRDTYRVLTQAGEVLAFWEFNLRFKTDASPAGPRPGGPVLLRAGMRGDRAQVIFAAPGEISPAISEQCPAAESRP